MEPRPSTGVSFAPSRGRSRYPYPRTNGRRRRAGIRLHRRATLVSADVTSHGGIPVTTPARTVADLPGALSPRLARRARRQAEVFGPPLGPQHRSDGTRSDL